MVKVPEDLYWVMVDAARDDDELTDAQKVQSLCYTIGLTGYEISEVELKGLIEYCKLDKDTARICFNRVFGSGVLNLSYPTGQIIDPESDYYRIGIPNPLALKEDIERRIRELLET